VTDAITRAESAMLAALLPGRARAVLAEALAGELKCKVGNPRTISEGGGSAGYWGGSRFNSFNSMAQNSAQYIPSGGEGDDGGRLPLGQIGVRASVSVTFDLIVPQ